jgi:predicted transporter
MSSDAQPAQPRKFPTELGALGGAIALWAALCAVAATDAGRLVGEILGFGAAVFATPLAFLGFGNLTPVIITACLGLAGLIGIVYITAGLVKPNLRPLAVRGVHFIGFIAALMLAMRGLPTAV